MRAQGGGVVRETFSSNSADNRGQSIAASCWRPRQGHHEPSVAMPPPKPPSIEMTTDSRPTWRRTTCRIAISHGPIHTEMVDSCSARGLPRLRPLDYSIFFFSLYERLVDDREVIQPPKIRAADPMANRGTGQISPRAEKHRETFGAARPPSIGPPRLATRGARSRALGYRHAQLSPLAIDTRKYYGFEQGGSAGKRLNDIYIFNNNKGLFCLL